MAETAALTPGQGVVVTGAKDLFDGTYHPASHRIAINHEDRA